MRNGHASGFRPLAVLPWLFLGLALLWSGRSYVQGEIVFDLARSDWTAEQKVARLKGYFEEFGPWAPAAYVGFVTTEVIVAPIPGLMLYAPGGLIFGPFHGGTLALIGNILGAGIACLLARSLGGRFVEKYVDEENQTGKLHHALHHRGAWLVFFLRLNPLTSSDLLSYAAGLTRIPVWQLMLATGAGMAPLCYAQSWLSSSLFDAFPGLIYPLVIAGIGYLLIVVIIVWRHSRRGSP